MRIPFVLAAVLLVLSVLVDLYIYRDIKKNAKKTFWPRFYGISSVVCWIFVIALWAWPKKSEDSGIISLMWMIYAYLSVYMAKIVYVVCSLLGSLFRIVFRRRPKWHFAKWTGATLALALFIVMWIGVFFTRRNIEVNEISIESPKIPAAFNGYKIAQISDLHVGTWGSDTTFVSSLVDEVNALHPDLIVFTGDVVNRMTSEIEPFFSVLSRLHAPDGVFSILGNHDYGDYVNWHDPADRTANNALLADRQKEMGWDLLNNERRYIVNDSDTILLIGVENVGDPPFPVYGDLGKALPASPDSVFNQNDGRFKVLLTHNPAHWDMEVVKKTDIDLTLTGHTHAMQMMLKIGDWKWSPAKFRYGKWGGMYETDGQKLYVNIGAGEVGFPSRLLDAYPEITLFTLHHQ